MPIKRKPVKPARKSPGKRITQISNELQRINSLINEEKAGIAQRKAMFKKTNLLGQGVIEENQLMALERVKKLDADKKKLTDELKRLTGETTGHH